MTIDASQWKAAAIALKEKSNRTLVDFINGQAWATARAALRHTVRASREKIEWELGQVATQIKQRVKGKNAGKYYKSGRTLKQDSLAERIILKHYNATGQWLARGKTLEETAANFIAKRVRTIGLIASGWIYPIARLEAAVRKKPFKQRKSAPSAKVIGKPKGRVRLARFNLGNIFCDIINDVPGLYKGTEDEAVDGLQKALDEVEFDMRAELAKRLAQELKPFGAK
jgi:hypothetical protein